MKLNVLSHGGGLARLQCPDDLTMLEVDPSLDPLEQVLGPSCYGETVLLSLDGASYIDSAGIGWLVMCHKRFADAGGRLVLHSISPMVAHAFEVLGLNSILTVVGNENAASALAGAS